MTSPVLVVGSLGIDSLKTPSGEAESVLGGTAAYFSLAASLYTPVWLVAAVGQDFPEEYRSLLEERPVDLAGLQLLPGKTFRWSGEYGEDLNVAHTLDIQLNVFADFHPLLPGDYREAAFVFLANIQPALQMEVLEQIKNPQLVAVDSRDFWIRMNRDTLTEVIRRADLVILNDGEVREFAETSNLVAGGQAILDLGPRAVVIKKGEHGALLLCSNGEAFAIPAYPHASVVDPTGAGDSFAGGLLGHLASLGRADTLALRQAVVHGSAIASYTVEAFGVARLRGLSMEDVLQRHSAFRYLTQFDGEVLTLAAGG